MPINLREVDVYRLDDPIVAESVWYAERFSGECIQRCMNAQLVRVAKRQEEVLGVYSMDPGNGETFQLHGFVVLPQWRKQGLGRWFLGHAIGVAESKGGRHLLCPVRRPKQFLTEVGFVNSDQGQRFDLIPE